MSTLAKANLDTPVTSTADLVAFLARGARPQQAWGIGTEMEKLVLDRRTGEAADYGRVEALLGVLEAEGGWRPIREDGHLIALFGPHSSITLEPGGQFELSGRLCPDLHCSYGDFASHLAAIVDKARALDLCFFGLGVQPFSTPEQIAWVPKARYAIMGPYMTRRGDMGHRMMKQSAGIQVNLDYQDEADCIAKLRIALATAPLFYALFANSPLLDGRPSGFLSTRGEIWSRTDPDRTGLLPQIFADGAGYATYVDYALDVPMYFILREGRFVDLTQDRFPFRRYLAEGFGPHRPTLADWDLHLSTLFPEARLRPQIEMRSADALPARLTLAVSALAKGLLYDAEAREEIWAFFAPLDTAGRDRLCRDAWRLGLKAELLGRPLREVACEALAIARRSLRRQAAIGDRGLDEGVFLDGIEEVAASGVTLAERLLAAWKGSRQDKLRALCHHCGFGCTGDPVLDPAP
jgi:glutamate--cysteine ligase